LPLPEPLAASTITRFGVHALALASRMVFGTQQSGRDNNLNPSSGNIVDEAADEEFPGQQRISLQRGDIDNHGLIWVGNCQCVEFRRSNAEVFCEQIWEWTRQLMPQSV
jgi:hypothetical protein